MNKLKTTIGNLASAALVCSMALSVRSEEKLPSGTLWALGKVNGAAAEFAPGGREGLSFAVGSSVVSRDFAGHHEGSIGYDGKVKERTYRISFDLPEPPQGSYELVLDLIYAAASPGQIRIGVNGRNGIFPVQPVPKRSTWGEEGNEMLLTKQSLSVPVPAEFLTAGSNQVAITALGLGSMSYDAVTFRKAAGKLEQLRVEPTIFFKKRSGQLVEVCQVVAPFSKKFAAGEAAIRIGAKRFSTVLTNAYDFGLLRADIEVPVRLLNGSATVELRIDDEKREITQELRAGKQWKVFVCPKVHNDVGYTDLQPHVNELDNRNSDAVLDVLRRYPFYKFNFETAWLVENYLDCRTTPYRREFLEQARKGRAAMNALYLNLMTGLCTGEELYRATYFTAKIHNEHGGNFDSACLTDAPSHTWFLPTLFSDVGIKGFSNGANQSRAPILHYSDLNEDSPYYWEGVNGEKVLMWYARSYVQLKRLTGPGWGGPTSSFEYLLRSVPQFLVRYVRENYVPDAVMIYGAYVDNAAIPPEAEAPVIERWNREFEFPKLIVATDGDYFNYISKNGGKLPVYRGDCGAYWEDGVGSTMKATVLNRETQRVLPAAEIAASLASVYEPRNRYPAEDFRGAWRNVMFYNEHTWGAHNSIAQPGREFVERQWEIKESYATRANLDARNLLARANNRLAQQLAVDGSCILAFNWDNRARTAPLEAEIGVGEQLVDLADNKPAPMDVYAEQDGWRKVRFLARGVPGLGYKAYAIRGIDPAAHKQNEKVETDTIENEFYRVVVDAQTGGLKSLFDKQENREIQDENAPHKLNEFVYVSGGEGSLILNFTFGTPPASLQLHKPSNARIVKVRKTSIGQRIEVTAQSHNTPMIRTEYLLWNGIKRLDIVNSVTKDEVRSKEAVYFAFPFAAQTPAMEYQIQNCWVRPNEDQMPGACREWFTPQNLVHVMDKDFSIAWSTPDVPLVTFTDINRGKWLSNLPITNGHVYSYAMNNYWFTNYRAQQGGTFRFRFSITSGRRMSREQLANFDADTRVPVMSYPFLSSFSAAISQAGRPMPAGGGSFLSLDASNLQLVTIKESETQDGWVLRYREIAGRSGEATLKTLTMRIEEAYLCNGVEQPQRKLSFTKDSVKIPFEKNRFGTIRLKASSGLIATK